MKISIIILLTFFSAATYVCGQSLNREINKDSLIQTILKDLPEERKIEFLKVYNESNEQSKDFLLAIAMPMQKSSKKELVSNIDSNFEKINFLETSYSKLVPKDYIVFIEFNPEDKFLMTKESIDLRIEHKINEPNNFKQDWGLEYNSNKLSQMLEPLKWTNETIKLIKRLLSDANCVSIENGDVTTIGFARSGMGKYSFKFFNNDLTSDEIKEYNNGCTFIFYKKNIVLEYGGGAIGPQCFPD